MNADGSFKERVRETAFLFRYYSNPKTKLKGWLCIRFDLSDVVQSIFNSSVESWTFLEAVADKINTLKIDN